VSTISSTREPQEQTDWSSRNHEIMFVFFTLLGGEKNASRKWTSHVRSGKNGSRKSTVRVYHLSRRKAHSIISFPSLRISVTQGGVRVSRLIDNNNNLVILKIILFPTLITFACPGYLHKSVLSFFVFVFSKWYRVFQICNSFQLSTVPLY
jgi:hypothetical protein